MTQYHRPVLVQEIFSVLPHPELKLWIDATAGDGGHLLEALQHLPPNSLAIAVDRDPRMLERLQQRLGQWITDGRLRLFRGAFGDLARLLTEAKLDAPDAILFDLGVSTNQITDPECGFSYLSNGPLDMRMDPDHGVSAREWLHSASEEEISRTITEFGEERFARQIARSIVEARALGTLRETDDLVHAIERAIRGPQHRIKSLARVFQAIRIRVNDELGQLSAGLEGALDLLRPGGRIGVIAYHSLEVRIIRRFLRHNSGRCVCSNPKLCNCNPVRRLDVPRGLPIVPSIAEVTANPKARSAAFYWACKSARERS